MKASAGYIAFFSFTPLFSFLPALSPPKLKFCSIASGHRQQHCHGMETKISFLQFTCPTTEGLVALPEHGNMRTLHLTKWLIFKL